MRASQSLCMFSRDVSAAAHRVMRQAVSPRDIWITVGRGYHSVLFREVYSHVLTVRQAASRLANTFAPHYIDTFTKLHPTIGALHWLRPHNWPPAPSPMLGVGAAERAPGTTLARELPTFAGPIVSGEGPHRRLGFSRDRFDALCMFLKGGFPSVFVLAPSVSFTIPLSLIPTFRYSLIGYG